MQLHRKSSQIAVHIRYQTICSKIYFKSNNFHTFHIINIKEIFPTIYDFPVQKTPIIIHHTQKLSGTMTCTFPYTTIFITYTQRNFSQQTRNFLMFSVLHYLLFIAFLLCFNFLGEKFTLIIKRNKRDSIIKTLMSLLIWLYVRISTEKS